MMDKKVKLTRNHAGNYTAMVRVKGYHTDPIEVLVYGPDPGYPADYPEHYRWLVDGLDDERWFNTLAEARAYLNRFFEPA